MLKYSKIQEIKKCAAVFILFLWHTAFAQVVVRSGSDSWKKIYRAEPTRINDLIHTKLDVKFDYDKAYMYGRAWLTLHPHFYASDSLTLDAKGMDINEVAIVKEGKKFPLKYSYDSLLLHITLDKIYKWNENYMVFIDYAAKPNEFKTKGSRAIQDAKGLYFINPKGEEKDKPIEIWTQGETESNSVWMPTIDKPNQKSTEEINMTVPSKFVTLSNGLLLNQKDNGDGTRTDTWKMDLPHAPYLFFMCVGEYTIIKDNYKGREVSYYVEKKYASEARKIFGDTPEMIQFFSDKLGVDFPWPKYAQIIGRDYVSGAMENTTATLHQEKAYQNARQLLDGNQWEDVIAHELFHQWFGDLVTSESWSNLTLNESFADYSETLWNEYKYGKDAGDEKNMTSMQTYLNSASDDKDLVRFYYSDKEDMFDEVSYNKGGCILNMLRNYTGDSAFYRSLHKYLTDNKFKTGEAHQLRLAFEDITGQDLNWFWNQWYFGNGHPVLKIDYEYNDSAGRAKVIIDQKQKSGKIFKLPIAIDVYSGTAKRRYNVWLQNKIDSFTFSYTKRPDLVNVDGDKVLLGEKKDNKTAGNFIAQIKYAPLYMDRKEALDYFAEHSMTKELILGLSDRFAGLRAYTFDLISQNLVFSKNEFILSIAETLAEKDDDRIVRSKALECLANTGEIKYKALFEKYSDDSSYSIAGAALQGLIMLDSANAYTLAKKYSNDAKGKLGEVIGNVFLSNGAESDYDFVAGRYKDEPAGMDKFGMTAPFCQYLGKLTDPEKIKKGIDLIVRFKNMLPESYVSFAEAFLNVCLNKLAKTKGREISAYINNVLK